MKHALIGTPKPLEGNERVVRSYEQGRQVLEDARFSARPVQADTLALRLGPPGLDTPQALLAAIFPILRRLP